MNLEGGLDLEKKYRLQNEKKQCKEIAELRSCVDILKPFVVKLRKENFEVKEKLRAKSYTKVDSSPISEKESQ